jgi:L-amino acid N-acyltransferase YncA
VTPGRIRDAEAGDAAGCREVYAPYVRDTTVTFEVDVPSVTAMAGRIAAAQQRHAWVVLEEGGRVCGYAYAGPFKERAAYRWACEVSVYLEPGRRGRGEGRALYEALFDRLRERGLLRAAASMTLPNEASEGLHRALGFVPVGTFRRVGWKHGAWRDVAWVQLDLADAQAPPPEPH